MHMAHAYGCLLTHNTLAHFRPAFMDEYEKLEVDLKREYEVYLEKFRNLDYLEHRLSEMNAAEALRVKQAERALKLMQARLNANVSPLEKQVALVDRYLCATPKFFVGG